MPELAAEQGPRAPEGGLVKREWFDNVHHRCELTSSIQMGDELRALLPDLKRLSLGTRIARREGCGKPLPSRCVLRRLKAGFGRLPVWFGLSVFCG